MPDIEYTDDATKIKAAWLNEQNDDLHNFENKNGGTGLTPINRQDLVSDLLFSVTMYGAVGDGVTDDGPAFNAAIAAVKSGGIINVPAPAVSYFIDTPVKFTAQKSIRMVGAQRTLIEVGDNIPDAEAAIVINVGAGGNQAKIIIDGFEIIRKSPGTKTGIQVKDSGTNVLTNIKIRDFNKGFEQVNDTAFTERNRYQNCVVINCNFGFYFDASGSASKSMASTTLDNVQINVGTASAVTPYGIYVNTSTSIYRSNFVDVNIFNTKDTSVGFFSDGTMKSVMGHINIEGQGAANNVGFEFGAAATDLNFDLRQDIRGTAQILKLNPASAAPRGFRYYNSGDGETYIVKPLTGQDLNSIEDDSGNLKFIQRLRPNNRITWDTPRSQPLLFRHIEDGKTSITTLIPELDPSTAVDQDTTPDVDGVSLLNLSNTVATTITNFDQTENRGRLLVLKHNNNNTTIQHNANIKNFGNVDFTGNDQLTQIYVRDSSNNYFEVARKLFDGDTDVGATAFYNSGLRRTELVNVSGNIALDIGQFNAYDISFNGIVAFSFINIPTNGISPWIVLVIQAATFVNPTWPGDVKWSGGVAPVLTNGGEDFIRLTKVGANWYGEVFLNYA